MAVPGRLGLVGLALVLIMWVQDTAPSEKSNVRPVMQAIDPSLRPGDLVVADGDGVVRVPRGVAMEVMFAAAEIERREHLWAQAARKTGSLRAAFELVTELHGSPH